MPVCDELLGLLSENRWRRREAAERVSVQTAAARQALRRALWHDPDAAVRAAAAARLGRCADEALPEVVSWLYESAGDAFPLVREAALRALLHSAARRHRSTCSPFVDELMGALRPGTELCARLALHEPVWWVRRTAVLLLAALEGEAAMATLRQCLADPFWRVRHAAAQALLLIGDAEPRLRSSILTTEAALPALAQSGLFYLRAHWQPGLSLHAFPAPPPLNGELHNADPAVVTARLRALPAGSAGSLDPLELVPLLADAHKPLRDLALARLRAHPTLPALRAALKWLITPTQPHAAETVTALLSPSTAAAGPRRPQAKLDELLPLLCAEVLSDPSGGPSPEALRWACRFAAASGLSELCTTVLEKVRAQHENPQTRAVLIEALGALPPLGQKELVAALDDPHVDVRSAAALSLNAAAASDPALHQALWARPLTAYHPLVRCALIDAAQRRSDELRLRLAAHDPHPLSRAQALQALSWLDVYFDPATLQSALEAADPAIRAAVLGSAPPEVWLRTLATDPDPLLRRRALHLIVRSERRADRKHHRASERPLHAAERAQVAALVSTSSDVWLRTYGCEFLDAAVDAELRWLLVLSRDVDLGVRAAAAAELERVEQTQGLVPRLQALLADRENPLSAGARAAAYAQLLMSLGTAALPILQKALLTAATDEPELVRAQLAAMAQLLPGLSPDEQPSLTIGDPPSRLEQKTARPLRRPVSPPRRLLGRTGIAVSPLGLSGVHDPSPPALRAALRAGINLIFWEPRYLGLSRFLRHRFRDGARRSELVIVAGSFEGDRLGIERDLKQALRRLGTSYIDVFLLFWVRSPERLSDEVQRCLADLKRSGRIRAYGFSTHHGELAQQAIAGGPGPSPWDVVMLRHSAAHPSAEERLLPLCAERGVGVITFSNLCYGRLLRETRAEAQGSEKVVLPTASECYRYSLEKPGVSACLSAPRSASELRQNLEVLSALPIPLKRETIERLRAHGRRVRDEDRRWNALLRKGHEGAPAALAALKLPAVDELVALAEQVSVSDLESETPTQMLTSASIEIPLRVADDMAEADE